MFDIGWSELVVIAVVALIAIGPKELPAVLRTVGQYMVLPIGPHGGGQELVKLTKTGQGLSRENLIGVRFVPLLPGQAREL